MDVAGALGGAIRWIPAWPVYAIGAAYVAWMYWLGLSGRLGPDPVVELEHAFGIWCLRLLILALLVTPIRRYTGISLLKFRRAIGVTAFMLGAVHALTWLVLDISLRWDEILDDITRRWYIMIGLAGLALLVPPALTSNNLSIRRLGPMAWRRLHWLVYPATLFGALHFLILVKSWPPEPIIYTVVVLILLILRVFWRFSDRRPS